MTCLRCGKCCFYSKAGKEVPCKFLIFLPSGKTLCRIYRTRIGTIIDEGIICLDRVESGKIILDCPYNSEIQAKTQNKTK